MSPRRTPPAATQRKNLPRPPRTACRDPRAPERQESGFSFPRIVGKNSVTVG
jgi:hypothetical protein